jgi:hypothetical protein
VRNPGGTPDGWRMTQRVATVRMVGMDPESVRTADMDHIAGLNTHVKAT